MFPMGYDLKEQRGKVFRGRDSNGQIIFMKEEISKKGRGPWEKTSVEEIILGEMSMGVKEKCP